MVAGRAARAGDIQRLAAALALAIERADGEIGSGVIGIIRVIGRGVGGGKAVGGKGGGVLPSQFGFGFGVVQIEERVAGLGIFGLLIFFLSRHKRRRSGRLIRDRRRWPYAEAAAVVEPEARHGP